MRKNRLLAAVLTGSILSSVLLGGCGKAETVRAAEDTTSEEVAVTEVSDPSEPEQKSETDPEDDVVPYQSLCEARTPSWTSFVTAPL